MDLNQIYSKLGEILGVVAGILTIIGALAPWLLSRLTRPPIILAPGQIKIDFKATDDPIRDSRLLEARNILQHQEDNARWNGRADASLIFGQYIIGGVLASSFIQQSLSSQFLGGLGILVLLSSLIRQRYRPDVLAHGAKQRVALLHSLIREVEDDLFSLKNSQPHAPSIYDIRQKVSRSLARIEQSELADSHQGQAQATSP